MAKPRTAITPTRAENYNDWYQAVIKEAKLAEHSPVRGCMVIRPLGYGIWEQIQSNLNKRFKMHDVENFYCPIFIPKSYLEREAEHIEGFATECAVVTHHRLEKDENGKLVPAGELEEPLIVRPTSETIVGEMFSRWIQSHRDLPLKLNQWANVVRWEMRTRLFLRTSEFLWQEGHTAHATETQAKEVAKEMVEVYAQVARDVLAIPVTIGSKSRNERFPGAKESHTIEALMQDNKALQAGTSHFLGQTFAKAFEIQFSDETGAQETAWTTSWGVSTRLIGGMIMTHSDDDGLICPPKVAPTQIVILPVAHKSSDPETLLTYCKKIKETLSALYYEHEFIRVKIDDRDMRPGDKNWQWIKQGAPIRIEIGPKELESNTVFVAQRNKGHKDKESLSLELFADSVVERLGSIQKKLYATALARTKENTTHASDKETLEAAFTQEQSPGFVTAYWADIPENDAVEAQLKEKFKITIRCLLKDDKKGTCIYSGEEHAPLAVFARAY